MKEYGGYLELEKNRGQEYYRTNVLGLNNARSALIWLLQKREIKRLFLPRYICDTVVEACAKQNVEVLYYSITADLLPDLPPNMLNKTDWVYLVNYFGRLRQEEFYALKKKYTRVILDNVQAFFSDPPAGIDTIYSCRKFFGVPDGAYLATELKGGEELPVDISGERVTHLVGRLEKTGNAFYTFYKNSEESQEYTPKQMSRLTRNLLRGIDYDFVKKQREENYRTLEKALVVHNDWPGHSKIPEGPYAYPLCMPNAGLLRKRLQEQLVYTPLLWPNVPQMCGADTWEYRYSQQTLVLPVDQRYTVDDMKNMLQIIFEVMKG